MRRYVLYYVIKGPAAGPRRVLGTVLTHPRTVFRTVRYCTATRAEIRYGTVLQRPVLVLINELKNAAVPYSVPIAQNVLLTVHVFNQGRAAPALEGGW